MSSFFNPNLTHRKEEVNKNFLYKVALNSFGGLFGKNKKKENVMFVRTRDFKDSQKKAFCRLEWTFLEDEEKEMREQIK